MNKATARLTVDVSTEFRNEVRQHALSQGVSVKDLVVNALIKTMHEDMMSEAEEDATLVAMAQGAQSDGFIGSEETEALLNQIRNA